VILFDHGSDNLFMNWFSARGQDPLSQYWSRDPLSKYWSRDPLSKYWSRNPLSQYWSRNPLSKYLSGLSLYPIYLNSDRKSINI